MKKLVLITGGAGFIGSHTADALAKKGYAVRILDNLQGEVHGGKWPNYLNSAYERIRGDVREKKDWEKALKDISYVYHLAAYQDQRLDFSKFFTTNTVSTALLYETIVEQTLPVKKVVLASSQFVYGDGEYVCAHAGGSKTPFYPELRPLSQFKKGEWNILCAHGKPAKHIPFKEDQMVKPTNSYGLSKYALEMASLRLGATYGIPTTAFRYSIVQGPRQSPKNIYSGALRIFIQQALAGVPITVYEDGLATRDFVNVYDVVAANVMALTNKKTDFQVFNVGGGKAHTVLSFAKEVKEITGSKSEILTGGYRRTDTRHAVSDISKLRKLGWAPKFGTKEAISEYVAWFKKEGFDKQMDTKGLVGLKKGITK
jgi:dTDP-L-rhamnose 4-epimerase